MKTKRGVRVGMLMMMLGACGAVTRSHVLDARSDAPQYLEAIRRAAAARGYTPQLHEDRQVTVWLDRETKTRIYFQARRNGIVLAVRTDGSEEVPEAQREAELARGESIGREIYAEAGAHQEQIEEEQRVAAARAAEEERREAEAAEARRQERAQQNAELRAFMEQNQQRNRAFQNNNETSGTSNAPNAAGASEGTTSSARCCINGSYYECPSAAALDQCAGRFARCVTREGMAGMERCLQTDPPDPSGCERRSDLDSSC
ncbi:MAG: hypothetical protein AAGE52_05650 [Myxococcota bacterium]